MDQDRLLDAVARFELREELIDVMDVPRAVDLWQHHHVELIADLADDLDEIVQHPRAVEGVDAGPEPGRPEIVVAGEGYEAAAGFELPFGGDRVLQVPKDHVHLRDQ